MSSTKGDRGEREVRNNLNALPLWKVVRIPSSGSGTKDDLPDLHVWLLEHSPDEAKAPRVECQYAAEVKTFDDRARLTNEEISALKRHARSTGAIPVVIANVDYEGTFVFKVDELNSTESGFTITKKRDLDDARTIEEFVGKPFFS